MNQRFDIAGASDVGKKRSENQDHFLIGDLRRQLIVRDTDVPQHDGHEMYGCQEGQLLVIADGMGGHRGGELASRLAVEATGQYVLDMMRWFLKLSDDEEHDFLDELSDSLASIQRKIWADGDSGNRQMGTTVTMAYLLGSKAYVVHAGDSRCYLLRDGELRQLTTDHTVAQRLVEAGALSEDDAASSRWQHVLWNCVGGGNEHVRPEAIRTTMQTGDIIMLCSDGLTGMISDPVIQAIIESSEGSETATQALVDAAIVSGGNDNISVIVCSVGELDQCDDVIESQRRGSMHDTTIN